MPHEVNLARTNRMMYLIRIQHRGLEQWEFEMEKTPLYSERLQQIRLRLEFLQLGSEMNGRVVNFYA
jgi:hypothetical protein